MMPEVYNKPPLTFEHQLDLLIQRGLAVPDRPAALQVLACASYYRLSAYWYPFRDVDDAGIRISRFRPDTSLDDVVALYEFDRKLRLLVLDAIERVEVAVRTRVTDHMAHTYGAFAHTDQANFQPKFNHAKWLWKLHEKTRRSSDKFVRHCRNKYRGFPTLPVWMATEIMSLGGLSLLYNGLKNDKASGFEDKKAVADYFNVHHKRLGDWLHTLTYVRNVCAHHSRLWNRELTIRPDQSKDRRWLPPMTPRNDRIFYVLLILRHLLKATDNGSDWQRAVTALLRELADKEYCKLSMGIPDTWEDHPLWI